MARTETQFVIPATRNLFPYATQTNTQTVDVTTAPAGGIHDPPVTTRPIDWQLGTS